jgi:acyl transferase domain-containing protein/NADPH:quinone reductase-like Zn-dependent oxidoreductase/NAD(P)-dependent dehydrogenase (short-subunit alcohol dehydrogenase family)/acyl carrier protein/protein-L-isoaspartate O-methyltransferase
MNCLRSHVPNAVAIIAMSGRFPGAPDVETLWRNVRDGVESISRFSPAELFQSGVEPKLIENPSYVPAVAVLSGVDQFDAQFFHFTAREAECTDPQHRLLLECAWETLEQAGYPEEGSGVRTGVYVGAGPSSYWATNLAPNLDLVSSVDEVQLLVGNGNDYAATRISYKLNLTGPSLTIGTACSTSLVAVHLACTSLLDFHCDIALAGGVSIQGPTCKGYVYQEGGIMSPDGHCRPFDAKAAGTVAGSGVAMVALRRLEDALEAGDTIHAIILGSAVNNDGLGKAGFTAPSENGQAAVIAEALGVANISPDSIGYLEAHGTGTPLGDPIEVAALTRAFRRGTMRSQFCALGSVKSNFGHLDAAAGVTGLIKAVLALQHHVLPPTVHFENPNPKLNLENSPFFVNNVARDWVADSPRQAGVSSFGIGGTNAHVVLQEAPPQESGPTPRSPCLLVLSAKTRGALDMLRRNLVKHLDRHKDLNLADVSFTLAVGRRTFPERCAVVCNGRDDAIAKLNLALPGAVDTPPSGARVAFLFSAEHPSGIQGILELYQSEPAFREAIDACTTILKHRLGLRPSDLLSLTNAPAAGSSAGLHETTHVFAGSFSLRYAVSILLQSWGVEPCAMMGGSLGEYVAAVLAGVFSLADALALVDARARLMRSVPDLDKQGTQKLSSFRETPYAPHPVPLEPMSDAAEEFLRKAELHSPRIPFVANLTGDWITPAQATDPDYWVKHLHKWTSSVDARKCVRDLPDALWLELGAGDVSVYSSERHSAFAESVPIPPTPTSLNSTNRGYPSVLSTLGELWTLGVAVDWNNFFKFEQRRRVPLPTYAFERQRYWIDPPAPVREPRPEQPPDEVKTSPSPIDSWFYAPRWTQTAKRTSLRLLEGAWILVADNLGLADAVAMLLRQAGARVAVIRNGDAYSQSGSDVFVFPLKDSGAHTKMWNALDQLAWAESNILLFELAKPQQSDSWDMRSESALAGTLRLMALVQGISLSGAPHRLAVITNNTQTVHCDEARRPEIATLWGALRVVAKEYPNLRCQAFDLDWSDFEEGSIAQVASDLLAGLACPAPNLALRAGTLWEQRVEAAQLTEAKRLRIRERGTYLITGGLGSMGMAFAEYLARTAHARLALVTRTGLGSGSDKTSTDQSAGKADTKTRFPLLTDINAIEEFERAARCEANLLSLSSHPGLERLLNRCCSALAWQFVSGGFTSLHPGARTSLRQIQLRLGVLPKFQKLFELLVRWLAEDGIVAQVGSEIELRELPYPDDLVNELAARFPQFIPLTDLISHCTRSYARALSGEIPALTVLYPDGTSRWLDAATADIPHYSSDPVYLRAAADLVAHLVETRPDPIRILEIGGGTGDLTSRLIELIGSGKVQYHFTDISPAFISQARDNAAKRGLRDVHFARFDISQPPQPQGFQPSSYDLVLGYNVIHATPDLVQTTNYLRPLLSEGGGLVLVESVNAPRWIDMIWGLTDGWWLFTDRQRRQCSPLVSLEEWEKVLAESGFNCATSYPRDPSARQQVTAGLIIGIASAPASPVPANGFAGVGQSGERIARARQRLSQMEADGAEVCVITADISNPDEVARAVEAAETTLGQIHGVIHTAGVLGQTLIHDQQPADVRQVLAPKVDGTICLSSVLGSRPLDFFILCSSLSAVEPIPGQFAYSAANAFLDSFAQFRAARSSGLTVSVDWGFWQELGMIETARVSQSVKQALLQEIQSSGWSRRGVEIFARILQSDAPAQLLVSPRPLLDLPSAAGTGTVFNHPVLHEYARRSAQLVVFSGTIVAGRTWLVDEHCVAGRPVLPGTAYLDLAVTAFWHLHGRCPVELSDVFFLTPMSFADGESKQVELFLQGDPEGSEFRVGAQLSDGTWQEHARGGIQKALPGIDPEKIDLEAIETDLRNQADTISEDLGEFWKRVESFTPHWRNVVSVAYGGKQGAGRFSLPSDLTDDMSEFALHPALLDTATGFLAFQREFDAFLPFSFGRVCVFDQLPSNCASVFQIVFTDENLVLQGSVVDSTGNEIIRIAEYTLRRAVPLTTTGKAAPGVKVPVLENVRLEIASPGHLRTLLYRPAPRLSPHSGEVEIEVRAAGLNFVEVLYALGMLPSLGGNGFVALGQECAGVVTRVGDSVHSFEPGQEVFGYGPACFSLYTRLRTSAVALKPPSLSFEEAAGLPAAYLTAWYSLIHLARLRPAERILIHAAAGGVGLAAVRIAQWRGAEIFATAGSPQKREFLQRMGVPHVMDSRSLLFADQIRQITKGDGIDVVLNCLSGDFIPKSLELLRRHGRFVELGKRDILRNAPLGLGTFANYIAFFAVDMGLDVPGFSDLWYEVTTHLQSGTLGALPHRTFDAPRMQEAFEYMAQARHIGKVILSFTDVQAVRNAAGVESARPGWDRMSRPDEEVMLSGNRQAVASFPPAATPGPQIAKHERPRLPSKFRAPESAAQRTIASVWEELLGVAPIGIEDDFFELNGDSLLAAQVMSRLQQLFEIKVPISLIFGHPTIQELAEQITSRRPSSVAGTRTVDSTHEEGAV